MKQFNCVIKDELGLHARPAGLLVKEARQYSSKISIIKEEKATQATEILKIMSMSIKQGDEIIVTIEGEDEEIAYKAMEKFFHDNL